MTFVPFVILRILFKMVKISLTVFTKLIEASVSELLGVAAELRISLSRGHLEVQSSDPGRDPPDSAVTSQEPASEAEAAQAGVEVGECGLGEAGHRVTIQGEQREACDPREGVLGQEAEQIKAEVENLKMLVAMRILGF